LQRAPKPGRPEAGRDRRAAPAALTRAEKDKPGYTQFLRDLLDVEVRATEERRLAGRIRFAGFLSTKTLEEFAAPPTKAAGRTRCGSGPDHTS
jgi:hypothetical protein